MHAAPFLVYFVYGAFCLYCIVCIFCIRLLSWTISDLLAQHAVSSAVVYSIYCGYRPVYSIKCIIVMTCTIIFVILPTVLGRSFISWSSFVEFP